MIASSHFVSDKVPKGNGPYDGPFMMDCKSVIDPTTVSLSTGLEGLKAESRFVSEVGRGVVHAARRE